MPSFDDYIVFVDESGDHGMERIDPTYPMFVLTFCIFEKEAYAAVAAPAVLRFKFKHFGHDQVILHEHDIRKAKGPFAFLFDAARREPFYHDLNALVEQSPFTLVASAIHKERHRARYKVPNNPYDIATGFGLERVYKHLDGLGCEGGNLAANRLPFEIIMADKKCNSAGLQVADLIARPIGRKILNPDQPNRAYDILERKFRRSPAGKIEGYGLKIFP